MCLLIGTGSQLSDVAHRPMGLLLIKKKNLINPTIFYPTTGPSLPLIKFKLHMHFYIKRLSQDSFPICKAIKNKRPMGHIGCFFPIVVLFLILKVFNFLASKNVYNFSYSAPLDSVL